MALDEQLPHPSGQQGYPPPPPQKRGTSGLAVAGLILAFLMAPIGFILSLIAVFKTGKGRAGGRGLAVAGLIVSALIIAGSTTAIILAAGSTLTDPGCVDGKAAIAAGTTSADPAALKDTADKITAAAAKAESDDVRKAMTDLAGDYTKMAEAISTGNLPADLTTNLQTHAEAVDKLCTLGA